MVDFSKLAKAAYATPALQRRAELAGISFTVRRGVRDTRVELKLGAPSSFTLIASIETWDAFAKPVPPVGYQSLVGMQRMGHLRVEGDMVAYGRNLLFLEQLFESLRGPRGSSRAHDS